MIKVLVSLVAMSIMWVACTTNTITGRKQLLLLPESELIQMAYGEYQTFLSSNKVVSNTTSKDLEMVNRVGKRVVNAVVDFYKQNNIQNELEGYQWDIKLVDSKEVNAWCMPGGKIVVYTGILPVAQNEAALANIIGHEISHAIFRHSNERMTQGMLAQYGSAAADALLATRSSNTTRAIFNTAIGLGAQYGVIMPFSRKNELEADKYGMVWAAMAGYNPAEAINLWQRMQQASNGQTPPEFLSTHPGSEHRIEELKKYLPTAQKYYRPMNQK